jgi:hypothetical protein
MEEMMKEHYIQELKTLEKNTDELKNKLVNLLKNKKITADSLLAVCSRKRVNVSGDCLNSIGLKYSKGENGFEQDTDIAFKICKFAADELHYGKAYGNCAQYYYDGRAGSIDLQQAYDYCQKAIEFKTDRNLLWAKILFKQEKFSQCASHIKKRLNDKATKEEEKKDFQVLFNDCLTAQLTNLYKKLNEASTDVATTDVGQGIEELNQLEEITEKSDEEKDKLQLTAGWYEVSYLLEGFDLNDCGQLMAQMEIANLQLMLADKARGVIRDQLRFVKEKKLPQEVIDALEEKEKEFQESYSDLLAKKKSIEKNYQEYIDVTGKMLKRQYQTELRFFDPSRTKNERARELALEFEKRRLSMELYSDEVDASDSPARRLITAERSTIEASTSCFDVSTGYYANRLGWSEAYKKSSSDKEIYTHPEKIKIGTTVFQYRQKANAHHNHIGDFFMESKHGSYVDTLNDLNRVTGSRGKNCQKENEIKLAGLMQEFVKTGNAVTQERLQEIKPEGDVADVDNLNRIFYHCFIKETSSWMLPHDDKHKLPLALPQARVLKLIVAGYLSIREVFAKDAPYGIFTGTDIGRNIDELQEKIIRINVLYDKAILEYDEGYRAQHIQFFKDHPTAKLLPTYDCLHGELKEIYGGDSDTDGEGYESDGKTKELYENILNPKK